MQHWQLLHYNINKSLTKVQCQHSVHYKYKFTPKCNAGVVTLFETSFETDFGHGGHPNEVGWLFSQYMYEIQTKWRYSNNLCLFSPKMWSWEVRESSLLLKLVWGLILTSKVFQMRLDDFFSNICSTGRPTEDILSVCATLNQKWGHQVLGIMLWGDQTVPLSQIKMAITQSILKL